MRVFFFLGHTFFDQSMAIAKEIKQRQPNSEFYAIVAARADLITQLQNQTDPKFTQYDWLNGLEQQWLNTPLDRVKLAAYEEKLGTAALRRILIADREVGFGFVTGGKVDRTQLIARTHRNSDVQWSYILGMVDYFYTSFERIKPDVVFSYCNASATVTAMGEVAQHLGIPFTQLTFSRIGNCQLLDESVCNTLPNIKAPYQAALKDPSLVKGQLPQAEAYVKDFRANPVILKNASTWINIIMKNATISGAARTFVIDVARWGALLLGLQGTRGVLRQRSGFSILCNNVRAFLAMRRLVSGRDKNFATRLPADAPYIYFPLHVDPEASTMVFAPYHTNQLAVIEALAKSMPAGMRLVVKEHKPVVGRRPAGFYERINDLPDVMLVSPFMDNFSLIANAKMVATITGTAGWEAIMLGKPLLVMGNPHYLQIGEGFVHCADLSALTPAIAEALAMPAINDTTLCTFIAIMLKEGFTLSPADIWHKQDINLQDRATAINHIADKFEEIQNRKQDTTRKRVKKAS